MMKSPLRKWVAFFAAVFALTATSCDRGTEPLTAQEIETITNGEPEIFVEREGGWSLVDTPSFYLGQPEKEALALLDERCEAILTYEGGWKRGNTVFKGCRLPGEPDVESIRIGFNPKAESRVFTLEVKREGITPELVRARFAENFGTEITTDAPRPGALRMETDRHRLFASWDSGLEGPGHIIFGLSPEAVDQLAD